MSRLQNHITLSAGRRLSFAECGAPEGRPVLYFHSLPDSRLEAKLAEKISRDIHVRFIGIDRPGYEHSSFKTRRNLISRAADVVELCQMPWVSIAFRFCVCPVKAVLNYRDAYDFMLSFMFNS